MYMLIDMEKQIANMMSILRNERTFLSPTVVGILVVCSLVIFPSDKGIVGHTTIIYLQLPVKKVRAQKRPYKKPSICMGTIFHDKLLVFRIVEIVELDKHIKLCVLLYATAVIDTCTFVHKYCYEKLTNPTL